MFKENWNRKKWSIQNGYLQCQNNFALNYLVIMYFIYEWMIISYSNYCESGNYLSIKRDIKWEIINNITIE